MRSLKVAAIVLGMVITYIINAGNASADMCGPSNLPILSYLNPWIKGCQAYLPGAGNLPQIPLPQVPGTAPAPVYVPPWGSWIRP